MKKAPGNVLYASGRLFGGSRFLCGIFRIEAVGDGGDSIIVEGCSGA